MSLFLSSSLIYGNVFLLKYYIGFCRLLKFHGIFILHSNFKAIGKFMFGEVAHILHCA